MLYTNIWANEFVFKKIILNSLNCCGYKVVHKNNDGYKRFTLVRFAYVFISLPEFLKSRWSGFICQDVWFLMIFTPSCIYVMCFKIIMRGRKKCPHCMRVVECLGTIKWLNLGEIHKGIEMEWLSKGKMAVQQSPASSLCLADSSQLTQNKIT